jgi:hypothetical protein
MLEPCKNCGLPVEGDFCSNCGQKVIRKRLTVQNLLQETFNVITNIEKGFWYTTHMLFKNPGELVRNFLSGATVRIFNPFRFLIIWMSVMVFLNLSLNILEKSIASFNEWNAGNGNEQINLTEDMLKQANKVMEYMPLITLIYIPFIALFSWLLFKKENYNFAEHVVANTYFYTAASIINLLWFILYLLAPITIIGSQFLNGLVLLIYFTLAFKSWFQIKWRTSIWKTILVFLGSQACFSILAVIGTIIWKTLQSL